MPSVQAILQRSAVCIFPEDLYKIAGTFIAAYFADLLYRIGTVAQEILCFLHADLFEGLHYGFARIFGIRPAKAEPVHTGMFCDRGQSEGLVIIMLQEQGHFFRSGKGLLKKSVQQFRCPGISMCGKNCSGGGTAAHLHKMLRGSG